MADKGVKTYSPKKVNIIFAGREITGYSEDSIVSVKPLGEGISVVVGADGEVARNMDPNECYEVTITLMGESSSNDFMSTQHQRDRSTGSGMGALQIKDLMGTTQFSADQAWVTNYPETGFGKNRDDTEWVLQTGPADFNIGGNS